MAATSRLNLRIRENVVIIFNSHLGGKYAVFSNFSSHAILYTGLSYPSAEHFYQYWMTLDVEWRRRILVATESGPMCGAMAKLASSQARREGAKRVQVGIDSDKLMMLALKLKFEQHADLRELLLSTGIEPLVHSTPWGTNSYWGVGRDGSGRNMMGKMLMNVRSNLADPDFWKRKGDINEPQNV
jgi:ribA/ribD-fused uncharacterized protein